MADPCLRVLVTLVKEGNATEVQESINKFLKANRKRDPKIITLSVTCVIEDHIVVLMVIELDNDE